MTKAQAIGDTGGQVERIYRSTDLPAVTGFRMSRIWEMIAEDKFPRPVPLGVRQRGWLASEIQQWQAERIAARDAEQLER